MDVNSIKEINRLRKEINRLLSKGISDIYFKVTIGKNWRSLKISIFLLQNFLLQLKNQRPGSKTACTFSIILILKGIMTFLSQGVHAFCWTKIQNLIKTKRNRKQKILHRFLERQSLCFSWCKNRKLKAKMLWVGTCQRINSILSKETFLTFVFHLSI